MSSNKLEQIIGTLTKEERKQLLTKLHEMIINEFSKENYNESEINYCHKCGSVSVSKFGFHRENQRYICNDCRKTFTSKSNTIFGTSKLDQTVWLKYVECMVDKLTLQASADKVRVGLKTSFFMRHRILECMKKYIGDFRVGKGNSADLDECFLRESFKGNHKKNPDFVMPRKARKHGCDHVKRGISNDQICILSGINDTNDVLMEIATRGEISINDITRILKYKIDVGSIINTDRKSSYIKSLLEMGANHNRFKSDRSEGTIAKVNSLHSRFKLFVHKFRGVSTRRLDNYLTWFVWQETFKQKETKVELLFKHSLNGTYETTIREYKNTPYLFMEHYSTT